MIRSLLAPLVAFALSSCFVQPGAFESAMTLNRDETFDYSYSGEIVAFDPSTLDGPDRPGSDPDFDAAAAVCYGEPGFGYLETGELGVASPELETTDEDGVEQPRPCTADEIAAERVQRTDRRDARAREDAEKVEMLQLLGGLGDGSDKGNQEIARRLNEQRGWSGVTYQGQGVWAGTYRVRGRVDVGFVFPLMPTTDTITPFVRLVPLSDGRVRLDAPALAGLAQRLSSVGAMTVLMGVNGKRDRGDQPQSKGTFTLTTDAELLTNNTLDGPVREGGRQRLVWTIGAASRPQVPEALLRL